MKPYYSDDTVTLYHGDCRELLVETGDQWVDAVITDPPYTARTHAGAKSNAGGRGGRRAIDFAHIDEPALRDILDECGRVTRGWVVATVAYQHAYQLEVDPPAWLRTLRIGAWVKTNPMPQISADRPGQGWEAIAYMHRIDSPPAWNGGGKSGNYVLPTEQGTGHPTAKPLSMVQDFVRRFTLPGGIVLDPFAGGGTTLRAAANEGRRAIGVELDERYCEIAATRLSQTVLDFAGVES
ncbi:methyltransferase [Gordonia phage NancyRae]|uniref:Methyltransferase n=1 Tax=Gordonia phage NancyRae TaxID=2793698 RepID=A0A7T0Q391_9CAUD|nr:methyltransferase [Gordonia phage NancyRae]